MPASAHEPPVTDAEAASAIACVAAVQRQRRRALRRAFQPSGWVRAGLLEAVEFDDNAQFQTAGAWAP